MGGGKKSTLAAARAWPLRETARPALPAVSTGHCCGSWSGNRLMELRQKLGVGQGKAGPPPLPPWLLGSRYNSLE